MDLHGDEEKIQVFAAANNFEGDFEFLHESLRRGDIIGITGCPGRTKTNELSLRPRKIENLSYCFHQLPKTHEVSVHALTKDTRYRQRYLDLIMNSHVKKTF